MMKQVKKVKCKVLQKLPGSSLPLEVSKVKEVEIVYRLFLVNCYLLACTYLGFLPSRLALHMCTGGRLTDK